MAEENPADSPRSAAADPLLVAPQAPLNAGDRDPSSEYAGLSYRQLLGRLAASVSIYTIGVFTTRFGALLLVPIYWRYLTPLDYGILAGAGILTSVITPLLGLAIPQAIMRFYKEWPADERRARLGSAWALDWLTSVVIGGLIALAAGPLLTLAFKSIPLDPYLRLAILIGIINSFAASPLVVLRIEEKDKQFVLLSVVSFLLQTAVILFLIAGAERGARGVLEGQALVGLLMLPVYATIMLRRARPRLRVSYAKEAWNYSSPLVPGGLIESVTPMLDRFILEKYVTLGTLGIYGLADTFASVVRTVSVAIKSAWMPFQIRLASERADAKEMMARSADQITLALLAVGLSLAVLGPDVIALIGNPAYFPVAKYMVPLILSYILNGVAPVFATGFLIARRTRMSWLISIVHLAVAITAAVLLIPRLGITGAVISSVLGYAARLAAGFVFSQRVYPIPFHWKKLSTITIVALGAYAVSTLLPAPPSYAGAALRLTLVLAYFPTMFAYIAGRQAIASAMPRLSSLRRFIG